MWDEEDRRRRLRREMMGGEESPALGFYDASGNYVGLTPQEPGWFTSTLFSNAVLYDVNQTSNVVERFLLGPRSLAEAPETRKSEARASAEPDAGLDAWLAPIGSLLFRPGLERQRGDAPEGFETDRRLADNAGGAEEEVDWSRVQLLARNPSTGKVVLTPLDPVEADAPAMEIGLTVQGSRPRAAPSITSTTGLGHELDEERARAQADKLARADALARGEQQARWEPRLDALMKRLEGARLAPQAPPLEPTQSAPLPVDQQAVALQMGLDKALGVDITLTPFAPANRFAPAPAELPSSPISVYLKTLGRDYLYHSGISLLEGIATVATLGGYQMYKRLSHAERTLRAYYEHGGLSALKEYGKEQFIFGNAIALYDLYAQHSRGWDDASSQDKAEVLAHATFPAIGLLGDLMMVRSLLKGTGARASSKAGWETLRNTLIRYTLAADHLRSILSGEDRFFNSGEPHPLGDGMAMGKTRRGDLRETMEPRKSGAGDWLHEKLEEVFAGYDKVGEEPREVPGGSGGSGEARTFHNQLPELLEAELAAAAGVGAKPIRPGTPAFEAAVNQGTIKWVVTESGELLVAPHTINKVEISHAVLSEGAPVLAAGEAEIATAQGRFFGVYIYPKSGHFKPSAGSMQMGIDIFLRFGIRFP